MRFFSYLLRRSSLPILLGINSLAALAQPNVTINSPANNTQVTRGQVVPISMSWSGSVAGIQSITISGTRDADGFNDFYSFGPSPPATSGSRSGSYTVPNDATQGENLSINVQVVDYVDGAVNRSVTLVAQVAAPPANDNFANAITLSGNSGSVSGVSNAAATKQSGEPNHAGNSGGKSVWWKWTAASSFPVTFSTTGSSFDTIMGAYTGGAVNTLTTIASNDDSGSVGGPSAITFNPTIGTTYYIAVDGWNGASGTVTLSWQQDTSAITVSGAIAGTCYDPLRNKLYVSNSTLNRIEILDPVTTAITGNIQLDRIPRGLDLSLDNNTLVVANGTSKTVTRVNMTNNSVVGSFTTNIAAGPEDPLNIAFLGNSTALIAFDWAGSGFEPLCKLDLTNNTVTEVGSYSLHEPVFLRSSMDKQYAYVVEGSISSTNCYVLDSSTAQVSFRSFNTFTSNIAANPDGSRFIYNSTVVNRAQAQVATLANSNKAIFLPSGDIVSLTTGANAALNVVTNGLTPVGNVSIGSNVGSSSYLVAGKQTGRQQQIFVVDPSSSKILVFDFNIPAAAVEPEWTLYE